MNEEDSSEDDYEDSDSNAEDYYQNDYPEDEQSADEYAREFSLHMSYLSIDLHCTAFP